MTDLIIVRHGSTKLNKESSDSAERIRGWSDVPLDKAGEKDARESAPQLKKLRAKGILTSDLRRSMRTAEILQECKVSDVIGVTFSLRPWNLGCFTGAPVPKCLKHIASHSRHTPDLPVPQGESFNTFKHRLLEGIESIVSSFPESPLILVTHHRCERLLAAWDKKGQPEDESIDLGTFLQKGIPTGEFWTLSVKEHKDEEGETPRRDLRHPAVK